MPRHLACTLLLCFCFAPISSGQDQELAKLRVELVEADSTEERIQLLESIAGLYGSDPLERIAVTQAVALGLELRDMQARLRTLELLTAGLHHDQALRCLIKAAQTYRELRGDAAATLADASRMPYQRVDTTAVRLSDLGRFRGWFPGPEQVSNYLEKLTKALAQDKRPQALEGLHSLHAAHRYGPAADLVVDALLRRDSLHAIAPLIDSIGPFEELLQLRAKTRSLSRIEGFVRNRPSFSEQGGRSPP